MDKKIIKIAICFLLPVIIFITVKKPAYCTGAGLKDRSINNTAEISINSTGDTAIVVTSEDGIAYEAVNGENKYRVISYTGNGRNVVIPDEYNGYTVTSIAANAFRGNEIITGVVIGSNITSIGDGAFAFCTSMYQIIIPGQVTKFGKEIFYGCNKNRLTVVTEKGSKAEKTALKYGLLVTGSRQTQLSVNNIMDIEGSQNKIYVYSAPSKVKWKSHNKGIALVNQYGKIMALKAGTAVITAKTAGMELKCRVKVYKRNKKNCLKVIYSKYVKKEMTDYEKIYAAHAWLIQNVKYDKTFYRTGTVPAISHTAEGAFNRGIAVCDGYSKAFIIIMEHYGIKCKMVTGGTHAWNMVKIKNKWYHVDCTYDDPIVNGSFNNRNVFLDFFLKTDKQMRLTHVWDYSAFPKCNSKKINKNYQTV